MQGPPRHVVRQQSAEALALPRRCRHARRRLGISASCPCRMTAIQIPCLAVPQDVPQRALQHRRKRTSCPCASTDGGLSPASREWHRLRRPRRGGRPGPRRARSPRCRRGRPMLVVLGLPLVLRLRGHAWVAEPRWRCARGTAGPKINATNANTHVRLQRRRRAMATAMASTPRAGRTATPLVTEAWGCPRAACAGKDFWSWSAPMPPGSRATGSG